MKEACTSDRGEVINMGHGRCSGDNVNCRQSCRAAGQRVDSPSSLPFQFQSVHFPYFPIEYFSKRT